MNSFRGTAGLEHVEAACRETGLAHVWVMPIGDKDGDILGSLGIYSREKYVPNDDALRRLEQAAHLAAVAIHRHRAAASRGGSP